jgi:thiol-disulfide isomerase/thioredoxin
LSTIIANTTKASIPTKTLIIVADAGSSVSILLVVDLSFLAHKATATEMSSSSSAEVAAADAPAAAEFSIENLLGAKLLDNVKTSPKPTKELMKGKELIGLYFSASWCPPCKTFSPILANFYVAAAKANDLEIVYISSDRTVESFVAYVSRGEKLL